MAVRWQIQFKSRKGTLYTASIDEPGWTGSVTQLTPSEQPFFTSEDESDDPFTPMRGQTGYIRIVCDTQVTTLLDALMPSSWTEKKVTLTHEVTVGEETDTVLDWQGYVTPESFSQTWINGQDEIEIPIHSMIDALYHVRPELDNQPEKLIGEWIHNAFDDVDAAWDWVEMTTSVNNIWAFFFGLRVSRETYVEEITMLNDTAVENLAQCDTYGKILEDILSLFGYTLRISGRTVILQQVGVVEDTVMWYKIAEGDIYDTTAQAAPTATATLAEADLTTAITGNIRGADGKMSMNLVGDMAKVSVDVNKADFDVISISDANYPSQYDTFTLDNGQKLYVVAQEPDAGKFTTETFTAYSLMATRQLIHNIAHGYYLYLWQYTDLTEVTNTVMRSHFPWKDGIYHFDTSLWYIGSCPCRFLLQNDNNPNEGSLQSGRLMAMESSQRRYDAMDEMEDHNYYLNWAIIWTVESLSPHQLVEGKIKISLNLLNVRNLSHNDSWSTVVLPISTWTTSMNIDGVEPYLIIYGSLTLGTDWMWNGSAWVAYDANNLARFEMHCHNNGGEVKIEVDSKVGYVGKVKFHVWSVCRISMHQNFTQDRRPVILSNLEIKMVPDNNIIAGERSSNDYVSIIRQGDNEKSVDLKIGTNNNNVITTNFIRNTLNQLVTSVTYWNNQNSAYAQRPEVHLVNMLARWCQEIRRVLTITTERSVNEETWRKVFTKDGRRFISITTNTNWREEEEETKFIEIA